MFDRCRSEGRKALIVYLTGGYPSFNVMDRAAKDLIKAGADLLEVGVPFSDPIADGPTIQASSQAALKSGVTLERLLHWARGFRKSQSVPLVFMTYMNPVHRMGFARFARRAKSSGVDGVIVPDLVMEEGAPLKEALARQGVHLIYLAAPTTPPDRRSRIARQSGGFLYAVSLTGVTGVRRGWPDGADAFLDDLKKRSPVPVAVGFGIAHPRQARRAATHADGVIVGSAIVDCLRRGQSPAPFARSLRKALDQS